MWDSLDFIFQTPGAGLTLVPEFLDNSLEDGKPDAVTNLGSSLEFDLTDVLGTANRSGTVVRVVLIQSGAYEYCVSKYVAGKNIIRTRGLLGQSTVSLDEENYVVGSVWDEVKSATDGTTGLTEDGALSYALPQTESENWTKGVINGLNGHWLRLRVVAVSSPVNPIVDQLRIDLGKQYLLQHVVQGQTVSDEPLGSSNGQPGMEFELTYRPLIENSAIIEVNEGAEFQTWSAKENFLNSSARAKDYVIEISADDRAKVKFGDGKQGKIPTPGVDNIRAIYRVGADSNGNVGARTISVNKSGLSFINRIFNPRQATGWYPKEGSTQEDMARIKVEGPASLRTQNRAITTDDFEELVVKFVGASGSKLVARALAIEETFGVKTIELVVVGPSGVMLTEAQRLEVSDYFNGNKLLGIKPVILSNHEVTVVNYSPRLIDVVATVTGGNAEQIKNAVTALLNPDATYADGSTKRWKFGEEIPFTAIIAEIFEVDPVNIKKVDLTSPASDIMLASRELPLARNITIDVI
jgi:hypothetical protein